MGKAVGSSFPLLPAKVSQNPISLPFFLCETRETFLSLPPNRRLQSSSYSSSYVKKNSPSSSSDPPPQQSQTRKHQGPCGVNVGRSWCRPEVLYVVCRWSTLAWYISSFSLSDVCRISALSAWRLVPSSPSPSSFVSFFGSSSFFSPNFPHAYSQSRKGGRI